MPSYLIHIDEDKINPPISNKFIQSIFGQHANEEPLIERLAEDYDVSLRSGDKHAPVHMSNPMHDHIRKHIPKTCKIFMNAKRGKAMGKGHGRGCGTLKKHFRHGHGHGHGHGHHGHCHK